jgi:predicted  nucleic acid-binding Zn-ribbon protein
MQLENLISVAAIAVPTLIVLGGYVSSINKRLTVMEQHQASTDRRFNAIDEKLKEVEKENENTRDSMNAIRVSVARIETYIEMSKDIMLRVDEHLRKSVK